MKPVFSAPEAIKDSHHVEPFTCGVSSLDEWLKKRSRKNETTRASRTYVVCANERVVAYYVLAAGAISVAEAPGRIKRNMPDPIPVMVLGRLAVDVEFQGMKLGNALLRDAILRVLQAADIVGIRALMVHAISEEARRFYEDRGFIPCPGEPMTLLLPLDYLK